MTKKILFGMMAATMMFATSCENELDLGTNVGETAQVTFSVGTPEIATRAFSNGETATVLQYAVYDEDGNVLTDLTVTDAEIYGSTTVNLQLTTGNTYSVIFWAAAENAPYSVDFDAKTMTVDYSNAVSNDENRDAFYKYHTFTVTGAQTETIELRRPFAQLNIGTSDYAASASAGYEPAYSYVKVPVSKVLNLIDGSVDAASDVEFKLAAIPQGEEFPVEGYDYLSMNYLLVPADKEVVDLTFGYSENSTTVEKTRTVGSVPVQRNYRTNLYGQLLTSDVDVNVEILPPYDEPAHEADALYLAAAIGGEITLESNVTLNNTLNVQSNLIINLNGQTITNKADNETTDVIVVEEGATLTINGNGNVTAVSGNDGYAIIAKGKVIINGGTYRSGLDKDNDGNCTIYARDNGEIYIYGGDFSTPEGDDETFVINKRDADRDKTTILIYGGTFKNFNPANNAAEGANTNFVAEGYSSYQSDKENNIWTVVKGQAVTSTEELHQALNDPTVEEVFLTEDMELENGLTFGAASTGGRAAATTLPGRDFVIDGNGKTLAYKGTAGESARIINVTDAAAGMNLTLKNITLVNGAGNYIERAINYNTNGTLTLENVIIGGENSNPISYAVNLAAGSDNAIVNISNSTITCAFALNVWGENLKIDVTDSNLNSVGSTSNDGYAAIALNYNAVSGNMANGTIVNVTGGTISATSTEEGFEPLAIRNSAVNSQVNVSATTTVTGRIVTLHYVAMVTYPPYTDQFYGYETLQGAIDKAAENASTAVVILMEDIDVNGNLTLKEGVTLDGDGHTLSNVQLYMQEGSTVENVNFDGTQADNGSQIYAHSVSVTIKGCTFKNANWDAIQATPTIGNHIVIDGCTFAENTANTGQARSVHVEVDASKDSDGDGIIDRADTDTNIKLTLTNNHFDMTQTNVSNWNKTERVTNETTFSGLQPNNITASGNTLKMADREYSEEELKQVIGYFHRTYTDGKVTLVTHTFDELKNIFGMSEVE